MSKALSLRHFLPYRCNKLAQDISLSLSRIYVEEFGLSVAGWRILVTLAQYEELQAKEIARLTNMDKVRVSRAVATLTEQGILERRVCGSDSRASILSLSGEGRALYERLAPQALAWERDLLQPLSLDERKALTDILDKLEGRLADMNTGANQ